MLHTVTAYARYFEIKVLGFEGNPFPRVRSLKYYLPGFVERNGGRGGRGRGRGGGIHGLHVRFYDQGHELIHIQPPPRRKKLRFDVIIR